MNVRGARMFFSLEEEGNISDRVMGGALQRGAHGKSRSVLVRLVRCSVRCSVRTKQGFRTVQVRRFTAPYSVC